jgi:hypothetical protein
MIKMLHKIIVLLVGLSSGLYAQSLLTIEEQV